MIGARRYLTWRNAAGGPGCHAGGMWTIIPDLLARPVPRYTSYPTAAQFSGDVGAADLAARLDGLAADTALSLYVHIPVRLRHSLCACRNTGAANREQRLTAYVEALEQVLHWSPRGWADGVGSRASPLVAAVPTACRWSMSG